MFEFEALSCIFNDLAGDKESYLPIPNDLLLIPVEIKL